MTHWIYLQSLLGGLLIGLAVALMWVFNGRITGISGIMGGLLNHQKYDTSWRIIFLLGLIFSPMLYREFAQLPDVKMQISTLTIIVAGLLVGFGTRYGSGCTSGHGVCGIARLSKRSFIATLIFMGSGAITVFLTHHV